MPCERCGHAHLTRTGKPACAGHSRGRLRPEIAGKACRNPPRVGQVVCGKHGGAAPLAVEAGKRADAERKAAAIMTTYGRPIETTATEALLDEVKWTAGYVAWLRERVAELDEAALIWGKTKNVEGDVVVGDGGAATLERATTATEEAKPHIYRQMLLEERQHLVKVCTAAISAGIEERRVRLAEKQGELVADVITRILDDLGLTAEQRALVGETVPKHLRLLTG